MKRILYILLLLPLYCLGQTTSENFVKTTAYKDPTTTTDETKANTSVTYFDGLGRPIQKVAGKASASGKDIITHIEYDRYGRQPLEYLPYASGSSNLMFTATAKANTFSYYNSAAFENTTNPYSRRVFENSPLNRVMKQAAPGNVWAADTIGNNDHTIKMAYATNVSSEVKKLNAVATWNTTTKQYEISFTDGGHYAAGELYKTITQDENKTGAVYLGSDVSSKFNTAEEFKNKEGQVVLKRTFNTYVNKQFGTSSYTNLDTYYVYDQFGNLTYVLPPSMMGMFDANNCYQYKYDGRNRLTEKKIPGKQWEYIVYDALDRVISTGPVYSPFGAGEEGWMHNAYDNTGRLCITGWYPASGITTSSRKILQDTNTGATSVTRYNQSGSSTIDGIATDYNLPAAMPIGFKLLKVNYYDNYKFAGSPGTPPFAAIEGETPSAVVVGLPTGSWTRVPTIASETFNEVAYTLYDAKGRAIQNRSTNYLGGYTQRNNKLDFDGSALYTVMTHKRLSTSTVLTTREDFTYTAQDRLLSQTFKINSGTSELMSYNNYNEIGQLVKKSVGGGDITGAAALQKVDYRYNIRGWLKGINDINDLALPNDPQDLFAFSINYTATPANTVNGNVQPLYNGNISETSWRTASDNIMRRYGYKYDKLNQLTNAWYQMPNSSVALRSSYDEKIYYDLNGNIKNLERNGESDTSTSVIEIDDLTYTYDTTYTDRLMKVADSSAHPKGFKDSTDNTGNDYTYDAYGNLITDKNKGITSITYNHLSLPVEIIFNNSTTQKIKYFYNADGVKVKKEVTNGSVVTKTDYLTGFQYVNSSIDFFQTPEGYVKVTVGSRGDSGYYYVYNYKDHLGNTRLSYTANFEVGSSTNVTIIDENHYYPFGLEHNGYSPAQQLFIPEETPPYVVLVPASNPNAPTYKIKYNGKELQDELQLNMYDYGWRNYMPDVGRWMQSDPLLNDLNFAFDDSQVDEDDDEEVLQAILTKTEIGGGIFNTFNLNPYSYGYNSPVVYDDPDGRCPTCPAGAVGAIVGGLFGGGIEIASQLYSSGKVTSWSAVGGSALQGAITGGVAGLTGGASLLATSAAAGGANAVGGATNRAIQGKATTFTDVAIDATVGAVLGAGGRAAGKAVANTTNKLSNASKGKLGEAATKIKYAAKGYVSKGKVKVLTGGKTPKGKDAAALYDFNMKNIFTGKNLTIESKFNTSGLTPNQAAARGNVMTSGGLVIDRTTSQGLGNATQGATTGAAAGVSTLRN